MSDYGDYCMNCGSSECTGCDAFRNRLTCPRIMEWCDANGCRCLTCQCICPNQDLVQKRSS